MRIKSLLGGLSGWQLGTVLVVLPITFIGACILVWAFRKWNRRGR